jgi:hypothetical protein
VIALRSSALSDGACVVLTIGRGSSLREPPRIGGFTLNKEIQLIILTGVSRLSTNHMDISCLCEVTKQRQSILLMLKEINKA